MPRQGKRPREVIDLTDEATQSARPAKSPRFVSAPLSSQPSAPRSSQSSSAAYSHAPSSSALAPSSSYNANQRLTWQAAADDDGEPSTQDLTQSDDGPALELYGSFGMCPNLFHVPRLGRMTNNGDRRQDCWRKILQWHGHRRRGGCLPERAVKPCKLVTGWAQTRDETDIVNFTV